MPARYTALSGDAEEKHIDPEHAWSREPSRRPYIFWTLFAIGQLLLLLLYWSLFYLGIPARVNIENCVEQLSNWSPALSAVEYQAQYFEGSFSATNEYKGIPDEKIDQAWNRVSLHVPALRLQEEDFAAMGKPLTQRVWHQIPEEAGGGYLGMTEVFHLLHCLAEIRKLTYPEDYPDLWAERNFRGRRVHTDHCLDIIRQRIMCTGDVGPVPFYDDPSWSMPMPDFSTRHQCRNFEKLLDWAYTNDRAVDWDQVGELNISQPRTAGGRMPDLAN